MEARKVLPSKDPTHLNGLYTPFVSPVPGGQKPLQGECLANAQ